MVVVTVLSKVDSGPGTMPLVAKITGHFKKKKILIKVGVVTRVLECM